MIIKSRKSPSRKCQYCLKNLKDKHLHVLVHIQVFFSSEFVNIPVTRIQKRHAYLGVNTSLDQPNATSTWDTSLLLGNKNIFHIYEAKFLQSNKHVIRHTYIVH